MSRARLNDASFGVVTGKRPPDTAYIFNPTAQSGRAAERWDAVAAESDDIGIGFARFDTEDRGRTMLLAEELAATPEVKTIVAFGGDGTISETIRGMRRAVDKGRVTRQTLPALAIVPFGTANNIAKSFRIPSGDRDLRLALETIRYGGDLQLDLGRVDGEYFADSFSIGVDPSILRQRNRDRKEVQRNPVLREILRDYALYAYSGVKRTLSYRSVSARIRLDDGTVLRFPRLTNLIVNNTKVYAGEFILHRQSRANDGLLDVIIFTGWRDYLFKFIAGLRNNPLNEMEWSQFLVEYSSNYQVRHIEIELDRARDSQIDGEVFRPGRRFSIACQENALTLKIPVG